MLIAVQYVFLANFNPRTPCGVRRWNLTPGRRSWGFQSTHPVWGATRRRRYPTGCCRYFNPRTPCGVRPRTLTRMMGATLFQSTHPVWGATPLRHPPLCSLFHFNPRTPCGVRPGPLRLLVQRMPDFNPRTPCGVRPNPCPVRRTRPDFNPRTPCGVRHPRLIALNELLNISIHAPRVGCDFGTCSPRRAAS